MDRVLSDARFSFDTRQRLFLYLSGVFLTALLIGDTIGSKLFTVTVPLGFTDIRATLSAGAIWFPITFLLTDVINEFYGQKGARTVTFLGFWMALVAFIVIFVARKIPAAPFSPIPQAMFDQVFGGANRLFVASIIAYLMGQMLDIAIFQALKRRTQHRYIWLRSTGSTLVSQLVDTIVVGYVAFGGVVPGDELRRSIASVYVVKVLLAIGMTPIIYALHAFIARALHVAEPTADQ